MIEKEIQEFGNIEKADSELLLALILLDYMTAETLMVKYGADVNFENNVKQRPIHIAARHIDEYSLRLLLDHGADVNAKDEDDWTALHYSAIQDTSGYGMDHLDSIKYFYENIYKLLKDSKIDIYAESLGKFTVRKLRETDLPIRLQYSEIPQKLLNIQSMLVAYAMYNENLDLFESHVSSGIIREKEIDFMLRSLNDLILIFGTRKLNQDILSQVLLMLYTGVCLSSKRADILTRTKESIELIYSNHDRIEILMKQFDSEIPSIANESDKKKFSSCVPYSDLKRIYDSNKWEKDDKIFNKTILTYQTEEGKKFIQREFLEYIINPENELDIAKMAEKSPLQFERILNILKEVRERSKWKLPFKFRYLNKLSDQIGNFIDNCEIIKDEHSTDFQQQDNIVNQSTNMMNNGNETDKTEEEDKTKTDEEGQNNLGRYSNFVSKKDDQIKTSGLGL